MMDRRVVVSCFLICLSSTSSSSSSECRHVSWLDAVACDQQEHLCVFGPAHSWEHAALMCSCRGDKLLSAKGPYIEQIAGRLLREAGYVTAWIGARLEMNEDDDDEFDDKSQFTSDQYPDAWCLYKRVIQIQTRNSSRIDCFSKKDVSCIKPAEQSQTEESDEDGFTSCGDGLSVMHVNRVNWFRAQLACRLRNAYLPTKSTPIECLVGRSSWINHCNAWWRWRDGTVVSYTNWNTNYPSSPSEECAVMYAESNSTSWETKDCHAHQPFICQSDDGAGAYSVYSTEDTTTSSDISSTTPSTAWPPVQQTSTASRLVSQTKLTTTDADDKSIIVSINGDVTTERSTPADTWENWQQKDELPHLALIIGLPSLVFIIVGVLCIVAICKLRKKSIERAVEKRLSSNDTYTRSTSSESSYDSARHLMTLGDTRFSPYNVYSHERLPKRYEHLSSSTSYPSQYDQLETQYEILDDVSPTSPQPPPLRPSRVGDIQNGSRELRLDPQGYLVADTGSNASSLSRGASVHNGTKHYDYVDPAYEARPARHDYLEMVPDDSIPISDIQSSSGQTPGDPTDVTRVSRGNGSFLVHENPFYDKH